jgi:hypothetical protein
VVVMWKLGVNCVITPLGDVGNDRIVAIKISKINARPFIMCDQCVHVIILTTKFNAHIRIF